MPAPPDARRQAAGLVEVSNASSSGMHSDGDVLDLVRPLWPPLRHVQRGWDHLTPEERQAVERRVAAVLRAHRWGPGRRDALAHLFTFLAQVETIAIEIPLRALPTATGPRRDLLRRQLVDEVFHSTIFARLAHELALPESQPPMPLASAERLLDRIRNEPDLAVGAAMLNLVAEAWIETLFRHAHAWGVADAVFAAVLADEERHVEEALDHLDGLDPAAARDAVRALEDGLLEVGAEPTVALAMLDLAGEAAYRRLAEDLESNHRAQLAKVGLTPSPAFDALRRLRETLPPMSGGASLVEDTPWRKAAREVWDTPRDPTMQGDFDVRVGHIPKKLLTPVLVAALGRAWAKTPRLNRIVSRGRVWQLPHANVGVRVLVADDELATVVIPEADKRSVRDISRMLEDGLSQLTAARQARLQAQAEGRTVLTPPQDALDLAGPTAASFSVAISNPGKFGLVAGAGSFSGAMSPSTDLTFGQRQRRPHWFGVAYLPAWTATIGCLQDHRVFDGKEAGLAMSALRAELSPQAVRAILRAPDSLPAEPSARRDPWMAMMPAELRMLPVAGMWKYTPIVVGGTALAGALGVGGYMLYQNLTAAAAAGAAASGSAASGAATASTPSAGPMLPLAQQVAAHAKAGLCTAATTAGSLCARAAGPGGYCAQHQPK